MKKFLLVLVSALVFASCATTKIEPKLNKVYVTNTKKVDLLPASSIKDVVESYQMFEGKFGEKSFTANLSLYADSEGIQIVLLNDFGIEVGNVFYDGLSAEMESTFFPPKLKCEYILLDLQNVYADFAALVSHYAKYGLDFKEESSDGKTTRILSDGSKLIEEITITASDVIIQNHLRGYSYKLTSGNI